MLGGPGVHPGQGNFMKLGKFMGVQKPMIRN